MAQRLFRTFLLVMLTIALLGPSPSRADDPAELRPAIAFASTRDTPNATTPQELGKALEIYLMDQDGTNPRRLTDNYPYGEGFPALSPDGKKIVFDSNRLATSAEPANTSDLFVMKTDGKEQTLLTRGSSASWSPDGKQIVFHASASGTGKPIRPDAGAPYPDSDIFVINVSDCLEQADACQKRNLTNNGDATVDDDPDWSPDGQQIVFTRHDKDDNPNNSTSAQIYVINADGRGEPQPLTHNAQEERAPSWSPDGSQILFACRPPLGGPFEICVMSKDGDGDGTKRTQLTSTGVFHGTPAWSLDGTMITFHMRVVEDPPRPDFLTREIWTMEPTVDATPTLLTQTDGINHEANWGEVRTPPGQGNGQLAAVDTSKGKDGTVDRGKQDQDKQDKGKQEKKRQDKDNKEKKGKKDNKHKGGGKRHR